MRSCGCTQIGGFRVSDMFRQRIDESVGSPPHYPAAPNHRGG
jgi:hypothetical protein